MVFSNTKIRSRIDIINDMWINFSALQSCVNAHIFICLRWNYAAIGSLLDWISNWIQDQITFSVENNNIVKNDGGFYVERRKLKKKKTFDIFKNITRSDRAPLNGFEFESFRIRIELIPKKLSKISTRLISLTEQKPNRLDFFAHKNKSYRYWF